MRFLEEQVRIRITGCYGRKSPRAHTARCHREGLVVSLRSILFRCAFTTSCSCSFGVAQLASLGCSCRRVRPFVHVHFEPTFFYLAVWENHFPLPVLNALPPVASIGAPVCPCHLSISISLILLIFTLIHVSAGPLEHPESLLLVFTIITLICVYLIRPLP